MVQPTYRVPRGICFTAIGFMLGLWRRLHDPMIRALDRVVRPPCEQVARIHDNSVWYRRCIDEIAVRALYLQAAAVVLKEQRDGAYPA